MTSVRHTDHAPQLGIGGGVLQGLQRRLVPAQQVDEDR